MINSTIISELWDVISERAQNPRAHSYVSSILSDEKGSDRALEKVGEECAEFIIAVKNESYGRKVEETADLLFHILIALRSADIDLLDVFEELKRRRK